MKHPVNEAEHLLSHLNNLIKKDDISIAAIFNTKRGFLLDKALISGIARRLDIPLNDPETTSLTEFINTADMIIKLIR